MNSAKHLSLTFFPFLLSEAAFAQSAASDSATSMIRTSVGYAAAARRMHEVNIGALVSAPAVTDLVLASSQNAALSAVGVRVTWFVGLSTIIYSLHCAVDVAPYSLRRTAGLSDNSRY